MPQWSADEAGSRVVTRSLFGLASEGDCAPKSIASGSEYGSERGERL